jgi:hypothetical protein
MHARRDESLSLKQVFDEILEKEGLLGIYKGLKPKLIQTTLNAALMLTIYEKVRAALTKRLG